MAGVRSDDIIYVYLPLYHSAGFLMGLCAAIERGNSSDNKTIKHNTPHSELTKGYYVQTNMAKLGSVVVKFTTPAVLPVCDCVPNVCILYF